MPSITDKNNLLIEVAKSGIKEIMYYKQALYESGMVEKTLLEQFTSPPIFSAMP